MAIKRMDEVQIGEVVLFNKHNHLVRDTQLKNNSVCLVTIRLPELLEDLIVGHKSHDTIINESYLPKSRQ